MAPETYGAEGFPIEIQFVDLDLYRLLCVFGSSREISLRAGQSDDFFTWLLQHFERNEASRLLVSAAATIRLRLDTAADVMLDDQAELNQSVGNLWPDFNNKRESKPLTIRDACNKILHANHVKFETSKLKAGFKQYLKPTVHLYGKLHRTEWKASIDIFDFVERAHFIN